MVTNRIATTDSNRKSTPSVYWSEYPKPYMRSVARYLADWDEQFNRQPGQPLDPLLGFPGDFHTPPGLPRRLREVLVMTAYGYPVQRIADSLGVNPSTVYGYRSALSRFGYYIFDETSARRIIRLPPRQRRSPPPAPTGISDPEMLPLDPVLSERKIDVLVGVRYGFTSREIAEILDLSVRTIGAYRTSIRRTLGMPPRASLGLPASNATPSR